MMSVVLVPLNVAQQSSHVTPGGTDMIVTVAVSLVYPTTDQQQLLEPTETIDPNGIVDPTYVATTISPVAQSCNV